MAGLTFTVVLALAIAVPAALGQYNQRAVLFDEANGGGNYVVLAEDYIDDLSTIGWDNRVRSVCVTGIWLFYQDPHFNTAGARGMEYVFGRNNYCVNILTIPNHVSSARFAGQPRDYRQDSFTLYENDYFQGQEEYLLTSSPNILLDGNHKSIIITGNSDWTIYDQSNYNGFSVCLRVPEPDTPAFLNDIANLNPPIPHGTIKSVRKGCLSDNQVTLTSFARANTQKTFQPKIQFD